MGKASKIKSKAERHAPLGQQILEADVPKQRSRVAKVKKTSGEGDEVSFQHLNIFLVFHLEDGCVLRSFPPLGFTSSA